MKSLFPLIAVAAVLCSCTSPKVATMQPTKEAIQGATTTNKRTEQSVAAAQASAAKAQASAKQATDKVSQLEKLVAKQQDALTLTQALHKDIDTLTEELNKTQSALTDSQKNVKDTSEWLSQAAKRALEAEAEVKKMQAKIDRDAKAMVKYHRLKWGVILVAVAAAGFLSFHFSKFLIAIPYVGIGLLVGFPAAVGVALAFIL